MREVRGELVANKQMARGISTTRRASLLLPIFLLLLILLLLLLLATTCCARAAQVERPPVTQQAPEQRTEKEEEEEAASQCGVFNAIGKNDLSPIDVVVKSADGRTACIKARFSLAIKVEESLEQVADSESEQISNSTSESRVVLGYLPLEHVVAVAESCPDAWLATKSFTKEPLGATGGEPPDTLEPEVLEMILTFECGKLAFRFERNETSSQLSSIKGIVKLGRVSLAASRDLLTRGLVR